MDINELFDRTAEAFRRYQAEMAKQKGSLHNPSSTELEPEKEPEKPENKLPTEKRVEQDFPKRE